MNKMFSFMRESSTARALIPIGLILIIFGIVMFVINNGNKDYIKVEATVTNVELTKEAYIDSYGNQVNEEYKVYIRYTALGNDYENTLENVSKYNVGDKITIYYNPKDPTEITQTKSIMLPIVIIIGGVAALTGGIVSAVNAVKKHKRLKEQERSWANE